MPSTDRCQELDALRGIAALVVVLFHFTLNRPEAEIGFKLGVTGVDLFFIISGFVIFMSVNKLSRSSDFVINRVSRLYPTYWAAVTFTFLLISFYSIQKNKSLGQVPWVDYLGNMTMFQHYLKIPNLDGPYWTMILEMIFYLGILFLFHFKWLKYINLIAIGLSLASVVAVTFLYENGVVTFLMNAVPLLKFLPLFYAGILFYKVYTSKVKRKRNYLLLVFCFMCQLLLFKLSTSSKFINQVEYGVMLTVYFGVFALFVNHRLKFLVNRVTLFLGKISFALYLTHQYMTVEETNGIIPRVMEGFGLSFWVAALGIALPVALVVATLITFYIEEPMGKNMKQNLLQLRASWWKEKAAGKKAQLNG
ncbi:acyltransferase family protein [Rufibacter glacialis]|nr:acyltransferase [Rufibacter glacialis]GGK61677.1 acyltransferase [Rufibacter glacialis]